MKFFETIKDLFLSGDKRSARVKKNIVAIFFTRVIGILINFLYVPITLNYLNVTQYGIWMTLTSIVAWVSIFDIGLGNGLRNKLTESLTKKDYNLSKRYISTAYGFMTLIIIVILTIFFVVNFQLNWSSILNTPKSYEVDLKVIFLIVISLFGIKFVLNIISTIFTADQLPFYGSLLETISNGFALLLIVFVMAFFKSSLVLFSFIMMLVPVIVYLAFSIYIFKTKYKELKPSINLIDVSLAKDITGIGIQFFFIQLAYLVIFQSSNILIAHLFSVSEVTRYNIAFKYFSILTLVWSIIMAPLWSAFTQALVENDYDWIKTKVSLLNKYALYSLVLIIIMAIFANYFIEVWTLGKITLKTELIWTFTMYTAVSIWNNIYSFLLNGINKIKIQVYTSLFATILHIPLAIFLVNYFNMGSDGVVISMIISLSFFAFAGPIQTYKIFRSWKKI